MAGPVKEKDFKINQPVWFIRGRDNPRVDVGKIYGFVDGKMYRLKSHGKHLTLDAGKIFSSKIECESAILVWVIKNGLKGSKNGETN